MEKVSGIYMIKNLVTGRVYVGSSVNMESRWSIHKHSLKHRKHHNSYLQNSYNKYGKEAFKFSIIEECTKDKLEEREQYWYEFFKANSKVYNVRNDVRTCRGVKHSKEFKKKISNIQKNRKREPLSKETKEKISGSLKGRVSPRKGKKLSEESKRKISESNKGKKLSEEHKQKLREAGRGRKSWLKGKTHSKETRKKLSDSGKKKWENEEYKNKMVEKHKHPWTEKRRDAQNKIK